MRYLEVFGVLTGVGVEIWKFCGVGAGQESKTPETEAESESEKGDSPHLYPERW